MLKQIFMYLFLFAGLLAAQSGLAAVEPCDVKLTPNLITIGATYNGATAEVTGEIPSDSEVIIEVEGIKTETTLLKKEHVFGLLWMNSGTITLDGLPGIYMLYLPEGMDEPPDGLEIGFTALQQQATVIPEDGTKMEKLDEFFKLKRKEGLYAVHDQSVIYHNDKGDRSFTCNIVVPSAIHEGTYTVKTSVIQNGRVAQTVLTPLKVEEVGLPAMIRSLAFDSSLIYGILATVIAILAGLLTGFIFKDEKGAH